MEMETLFDDATRTFFVSVYHRICSNGLSREENFGIKRALGVLNKGIWSKNKKSQFGFGKGFTVDEILQ